MRVAALGVFVSGVFGLWEENEKLICFEGCLVILIKKVVIVSFKIWKFVSELFGT